MVRKYLDKLIFGAALLALAVAATILSGGTYHQEVEYASRLFDPSLVHHVDLQVEDWDAFLTNARQEEYVPCQVTIDGESFSQVGLRAKGNNSMRLTAQYGLERYSLKLEFDRYIQGRSYYGLDKFSLDSSFQDNSYLKTWLVYDMMAFLDVPAPLCSFVWVTVNGEPWGLFLAIEEPEEAFALRNFGPNHGQLYKPDYRSLRAENADVALRYIDDQPESYPNIFDNAKFHPTQADKQRLIQALKILASGENLSETVNVDQVLRYFAVQVFVMNWDSYLGPTGHNYYLYEEDGKISILPWDYNLAFGTYALGMTNPVKDPTLLINFPINTPASWEVMRKRPLYHNLMKYPENLAAYHGNFEKLLAEYFESGVFAARLQSISQRIRPYVAKDPTAFCTLEDHLLAVDTLQAVCDLRAKSIRGQLSGQIPITLRGQQEHPEKKLDASHICLEDLGDFDDLTQNRQNIP